MFQQHDLDLDLAAVDGIGAGSAVTAAVGAARGEATPHAQQNDDKLEVGGGVDIVDCDHAEERKGGGGGSGEGGTVTGSGVAPPVLESVGDRAEYESTLAALKVTVPPQGLLLLLLSPYCCASVCGCDYSWWCWRWCWCSLLFSLA